VIGTSKRLEMQTWVFGDEMHEEEPSSHLGMKSTKLNVITTTRGDFAKGSETWKIVHGNSHRLL
jgi:hypothetical protein